MASRHCSSVVSTNAAAVPEPASETSTCTGPQRFSTAANTRPTSSGSVTSGAMLSVSVSMGPGAVRATSATPVPVGHQALRHRAADAAAGPGDQSNPRTQGHPHVAPLAQGHPHVASLAHRNAASPVMASPRLSACISSVPS